MKVYFVGAGPGDPDLLTIRGSALLKEADRIVYAGSLVNKELLESAKDGAQIYNSATMTLEEILHVLVEGVKKKERVVRLHTGDPSLYGAIKEQMILLEREGVEYEMIPGISSFLGAAAALQCEYTIPEVSQTLIITRIEGRTSVPQKERLSLLAKHQTSMVIFLSIQSIDMVVEELGKEYPEDTPVAVVYKVSWPEEKWIRGTLKDIGAKVKREGIKKTALILIGNFLEREGEPSKLYDSSFSHEYRERGG